MCAKRFILSFTFFWLLANYANSQNLVLNPSFEDTIKLPDPTGNVLQEYTTHWTVPINHNSSPDYFHELAPLYNSLGNLSHQVPLNAVGFQYAQDGQAYTNLCIYGHYVQDREETRREYLTGKLSSKLEVGKCYRIVFYVSLTEAYASITISSLGIYFSDSIPVHTNSFGDGLLNLDVNPQIVMNQWIPKQDNWVKFERYYFAKGNENFFTIGNFKSNQESTYSDTMFVGHSDHTRNENLRISCIYIDNVSVEEVPISSLGFENVQDITLCEGDTLAFTLPGDSAAIVWNNVSNDTLIVDSSGTYWYQAYKGCAYQTDTFQVVYISNERAAIETIEFDTLYCGKEEVILDAGNQDPINSYHWNTGEETQQIVATEKGNYAVWIENQCNADRSTFQIQFNPQKVNDYNVFTPNGDNINETLQLFDGEADDYQLEIYNRWGRLIWTTTDPSQHWNGGDVSDGVYYYHLSFTNCANELIERNGTVTVIK